MRRGHPDDWTDHDDLVLVTNDEGEERWVDRHTFEAERELDSVEWRLDDDADLPF